MPHEWDNTHPPFLLPKELRDIEHKELLESRRYQDTENQENESVPQNNTSPNRPAKYVNVINDTPVAHEQIKKEKPEDNIPNININQKDANGNLKPITNMDELAVLMGTDPETLQQTKKENADT